MNQNISEMIAEHHRRAARFDEVYNPVIGDSTDPGRIRVSTPLPDCPSAYVPRRMVDDPAYPTVQRDPMAWQRLRCHHDFEYWCATCCMVKHKITACDVRLHLNRPQRRVVAILEADRLAERPLRLIMLKARQWGGSLLYIYSYIYKTMFYSRLMRNIFSTYYK